MPEIKYDKQPATNPGRGLGYWAERVFSGLVSLLGGVLVIVVAAALVLGLISAASKPDVPSRSDIGLNDIARSGRERQEQFERDFLDLEIDMAKLDSIPLGPTPTAEEREGDLERRIRRLEEELHPRVPDHEEERIP